MEALAKSKCFRRGDGFEWRLAGIIMPVVFFMVISPSNLYAQTHGRWLSAEPTLTFDRFSVDQGLSQSLVCCIWQDRQGFMWFGTEDGLNKYDGYGFKHFKHDPENPNSLSHNFILTISEDRTGLLWIGTWGGGLNRFDPVTEQFTRYRHDPDNPGSLSHNTVFSIYEDSRSSGTLWIGTIGGGLNRFDSHTGQFSHYRHDPDRPNSLSHDAVNDICQDQTGALWIGTANGLDRFMSAALSPSGGENDDPPAIFTHFRHDPKNPQSLSKGPVSSIYLDREGVLWVGVVGGGLDRLLKTAGEFVHYRHDPKDPHSLSDNSVEKVYEDHTGVLWIGTNLGGLNRFDRFGFVALNYASPEKNQYKHMMEGFDADWTEARTRRFATYTNLDPGEYTFRVKGSNNDGIWNERGAALKIIITPPYWQTWWFRAGASITILLLAFTWYRRRINHIEARKRELEVLVEERTRAVEALGNALAEVERLKNRLQAENVYLQDEIKVVHNFENIITRSAALTKVLRNVEQVASSDATVLILGESGTGKELVARAVHRISPRSNRPLVKVNCSALPANLIESELFGHEKGAYTGAVARKIGRFELADGGTIFLDEIGDLPLELQAKLLRVLQEGEFERLGNPKTIKVDVRVIAATNRDLEKEMDKGNFREDLYYRLNVFPIRIPPLRERKEDISLLINHFVKKYSAKIGKKIESIPQEVLDTLLSYHWPGNVRELENIIERAVIISTGSKLMLGDWLPKTEVAPFSTAICTLEETERHHILSALEKTNWRVSGEKGAAKILGINPKTLESRMKKLEIRRKRLTSDAVRNS